MRESATPPPSPSPRVLVGVDASPAGREALRRAHLLAERFGARLTLVHVLPDVARAEAEAPDFAPFDDHVVAHARRFLQDVSAALGPGAEARVCFGTPAEVLAREAEDEAVACVVVGSRQLGPLGRVLLGSVSDELLRRCKKPVFVVPAPG